MHEQYFFVRRTMKQKINVLEEWYDLDPNGDNAGCLFLGYEAFRSIVFWKSSNSARAEAELTMKKITNYLLKPGKKFATSSISHIHFIHVHLHQTS